MTASAIRAAAQPPSAAAPASIPIAMLQLHRITAERQLRPALRPHGGAMAATLGDPMECPV